jgi:hypothetical protein
MTEKSSTIREQITHALAEAIGGTRTDLGVFKSRGPAMPYDEVNTALASAALDALPLSALLDVAEAAQEVLDHGSWPKRVKYVSRLRSALEKLPQDQPDV